MTEHPERHGSYEPGSQQSASEPVRTGVAGVDAVIAAVEQLEDRPIEEHVAVFESAHEQLRRALDGQAGPSDQPVPS